MGQPFLTIAKTAGGKLGRVYQLRKGISLVEPAGAGFGYDDDGNGYYDPTCSKPAAERAALGVDSNGKLWLVRS